ncbi:HK97 family phage prohead protease [Aliarcobacter cryaerophilus]|uniref:HK97 family phage prohead protease n=1 Tax=Aliarcobacter cryaerophilus TaxID=28198 RepID=UPI0021B1B4AF|nr:HK97 family phage prohead protease [Aliarcobacter cryaerophilus]MCT7468968.1 HK97 family phage prohead protease [Aliarcobacter cryaerophilus]
MQCRCNKCEFNIEDYKVTGIVAPYNKRSKDLGGFYEIIAPGAFDSVLTKNENIIAVLDHSRDSHKILGSTQSGTLELRSTDQGLEFSLDIAKTSTGTDIVELLKRGDLSKMSFAFSLDKGQDSWDFINGETIRTIRSFKSLHDISIVSNPAYNDTSVA